MVKLIKYSAMGILSLSALVFTSCKDKAPEDTKEAAQEMNDKNLEGRTAEKNAQFAVDAYSAGLLEIELSKHAKEHSANADVKALADQMIQAHTQVNAELKQIAEQKNIALATDLSDDQRDKLNKQAKTEGAELDEHYAEKLVSDHKNAVSLFEKASEKEEDAEFKNFFTSKLPEIKHHLEMAQELETKVKSRKS
jgi:putative membrane protein